MNHRNGMTFQVKPPQIVSKRFEMGPTGYQLKYFVNHAKISPSQLQYHNAMSQSPSKMKLFKAANFTKLTPSYSLIEFK